MKPIPLLLLLCAFLSCKEKRNVISQPIDAVAATAAVAKAEYPEAFAKLLAAHGGLKAWKSKRTLAFDIPKPDARETHTTDLYSRKDKIELPEVSMGFDGERMWVSDENETYKGDPLFYHNLMFYFYAMPFVLADDGIIYSNTYPLDFQGKSYPGLKIAYKDGVGASSKDEYFVHYDPETHQMAWLGYTVTYRSGKKSEDVKWIHYNDWMTVEELILPQSISWFEYEERTLKAPRYTLKFDAVSLSKTAKPEGFYAMPSNAKVVVKQE